MTNIPATKHQKTKAKRRKVTSIHIIKKHGGARKGAGRKRGTGKGRKRTSSSVSFANETWRMIDRERGRVSRSRWIEGRMSAESIHPDK